MEAARDQVRVEQAPTRCPFCHTSVDPAATGAEAQAWVACARCLGRHHAACWDEAGRCGSCGHEARLTPAEAEGRPAAAQAFSPVEAAPDEVARARREAAALFDDKAFGDGWWIDAVVGPLTLGVVPLLLTERRLRRHAEHHAASHPPLPPELEPALAQRIARGRSSSRVAARARAGLALVVLVVGALALLGGLVQNELLAYPDDQSGWAAYRAMRDLLEVLIVGGWLAFTAALNGYVHAVREGVRAHELRVLFEGLVLRAAPKAKADALLRRTGDAWTTRRVADTVLTAASFVPVLGLLAVPLLCVRMSGALALHRKHEEALDADVPPPSTHPPAKGA